MPKVASQRQLPKRIIFLQEMYCTQTNIMFCSGIQYMKLCALVALPPRALWLKSSFSLCATGVQGAVHSLHDTKLSSVGAGTWAGQKNVLLCRHAYPTPRGLWRMLQPSPCGSLRRAAPQPFCSLGSRFLPSHVYLSRTWPIYFSEKSKGLFSEEWPLFMRKCVPALCAHEQSVDTNWGFGGAETQISTIIHSLSAKACMHKKERQAQVPHKY